MSFEVVKKGKFEGQRSPKERITVGGNNGKNVRIAISIDLWANLGRPTRVNLMLGKDRDLGLVRMVATNSDEGYKLNVKGGTAILGVYPTQIGLPTRKFPTTSVGFVASKEYIEFELPKIKEVK